MYANQQHCEKDCHADRDLKYEGAFRFGCFMHISCDEPIRKAVKEAAAAVLRELTYLCTKPYGWVIFMRCCSMWERTAMIRYFHIILVSSCHQPVEFVVPSVVCRSKGPALLVAFCIYQKIISIWQLLSEPVVNLLEDHYSETIRPFPLAEE